MPRAAIYVRLSQEDRGGAADTADKLHERVNACHSLAARHGLKVDAADVYVEVQSGSKLSNRPQAQALLEKCKTRVYTHVVTAAIDRLTRGDKRDEQTIEDALLAGEISVVTESQVIVFDEDYDERHALPFEVLAAAARQYRRAVIKKAKTAYTQRVREGKYGVGTAPYGYRWVGATEGRKVAGGWYEIDGDIILTEAPPEEHSESSYLALARRQSREGGALLHGVECVGGQYYWLGAILAMIRENSCRTIARFLRDNEAPIPDSRGRARTAWTEDAVLSIVRNPFCAGYPAQRRTTNRNGAVQWLPEDRWIYAENEQPYPHPISLEEYKEIRATLASRSAHGSAPKTDATHLLTGILYCMAGEKMQGSRNAYHCACRKRFQNHAGSCANIPKTDALAKTIIRDALAALPASVSPLASNSAPKPVAPRLLPQKRRELLDLQKSREIMVRYGGEEAYRKAEAALIEEIQALEAQERDSRETLTAQEERKRLHTLVLIREVPFESLWEEMSEKERQSLARAIIQRIEVESLKKSAIRRDLRIKMQPYIETYYPSRIIAITRAPKS